ncbi:hypothetical protein, partial [Acinetobacter geminorum]|uniref:hypothetical protein n=1 Tax=Acinetobacter geminorum TaxID=2730922 RepID=UPI003AF6DD5B
MKYLVSALCLTYLPTHAFAESLQDSTNAVLPSIPEITDSSYHAFGSDKGYILMCAEKTGGFNLVNYRHSSGVYHEQETEDLHR